MVTHLKLNVHLTVLLQPSRHYGRDTKYIEISDKVDIDNHVVDCKVLHSWIDSQQHPNPEVYETDGLYNEFRKKSQKEVNYLVKEFECRKSADAYARAGQSKTGVLILQITYLSL